MEVGLSGCACVCVCWGVFHEQREHTTPVERNIKIILKSRNKFLMTFTPTQENKNLQKSRH